MSFNKWPKRSAEKNYFTVPNEIFSIGLDFREISLYSYLLRCENRMSHVLGIGLAHAYEVAHRRDFPTITLGSRIIVPRDKFMEWIDEQAAKKSEIF